MVKLTEKRLAALKAVAETPGKSGAYWREYDHAPATLRALSDLGLIYAKKRNVSDHTIIRKQWSATDTGRAAIVLSTLRAYAAKEEANA